MGESGYGRVFVGSSTDENVPRGLERGQRDFQIRPQGTSAMSHKRTIPKTLLNLEHKCYDLEQSDSIRTTR